MKIYCDESGNTGAALLDTEQPFFALASTSIDAGECAALLQPLLRQGQREVKYSKLKASRDGQRQLISLFSSPQLRPSSCKFRVTDKKFYLIAHIVDKLIEPPLHEAKLDLYSADAHVSLTNLWFHAGSRIFPRGHWKRVQEAFLAAARQLSPASFEQFDRVLERAYRASPAEYRDFATGLFLAHGRLTEFLGCYEGMTVFDPAVDDFAALMQSWMLETPDRFGVMHDQSKPLRRSEELLRAFMSPSAPTRFVGYGERKEELPLRISMLEFGDSHEHPPLQLADLIAGAVVDWCQTNSGNRPASDYHARLRDTCLLELCVGTLLPTRPSESANTAPALAGEVSLVDGSTDFLREVGYINKVRAK